MKDQFQFSPPLKLENTTYFDVDNFSSSEVVQVALEAIEKSEKLFLFFNLENEVPAGKEMRFITAITKYKGDKLITYSGHHDTLVPLISKMGGVPMKTTNLEKEAANFFS